MPGAVKDQTSIPAVILAGGRSSRMGSNKAFVTIGGATMLSRIAARIRIQTSAVALNADPGWPDYDGLRLIPDTMSEKPGPLAGVLAAMRDTAATYPSATHVATVPIDSPFFPLDLLKRMADTARGSDEIVIASSAGQDHPVFGLWPVSAAGDLQSWLVDGGHRRVRDFLQRHYATTLDFPLVQTSPGAFDPFFNVNTPDDVLAAEKWLEVMPE
jgi:molybdopterin-guanine dinucleotide biosynthesis protein A